MKQPERVAELLAELRALAETDFERHRIDVLERDLTVPPTVEVIDDTHQRFDGVTYCKHKDGHYTFHHSLHRVVWKYCVGEIPEGHSIHHVDKDKSNNAISNFQLLTASEHKSLHNLTTKRNEYICEFCGEKFLSSALVPPRFCSTKCNGAWHKEHERELRTCPVCKKSFSVYKHSRQIYCSHYCSNQVVSQKNIKPTIERNCAVCGKKFTVSKHHQKQVCCSRPCGSIFAAQQRKKNLALNSSPNNALLQKQIVTSKPTESSITDE